MADRLARSMDLALPAAVVDWVAARARRARPATVAVCGLVSVSALPWYGYLIQDGALSGWASQQPQLLTWVVFPSLAAAECVARSWDVRQALRSGQPVARGEHSLRLQEAIPPPATWLVGLMALLPAAAVAATSLHRMNHTAGRQWLCLAVVTVSLGVAAAVEGLQLRVLRGPRLGCTPAEAAFDAAFRASAALRLAVIPVAVASVSLALAAWPLVRAPGSPGPFWAVTYLAGSS